MNRLLVTGAGGFLGWHLCRLAANTWQVWGTCRSSPVDLPGVVRLELDLTDEKRTIDAFEKVSPDAVIHAAAAASPDVCEAAPAKTAPINETVPVLLARCCAERQLPYVFTSTDLVFSGDDPPYAETDNPSPVNVYGRQKVRGENGVLHVWPKALVCRLPLMFGASGSIRKAFDHEMIRRIRLKIPLKLFTDEFRTPVDGVSAARGILHLLGQASGILHLGGRQRISRYDMGRRLAGIMGVEDARLVASRQKDADGPARRPADVSLASRRAYGLGYDPLGLDEALKAAAEAFPDAAL